MPPAFVPSALTGEHHPPPPPGSFPTRRLVRIMNPSRFMLEATTCGITSPARGALRHPGTNEVLTPTSCRGHARLGTRPASRGLLAERAPCCWPTLPFAPAARVGDVRQVGRHSRVHELAAPRYSRTAAAIRSSRCRQSDAARRGRGVHELYRSDPLFAQSERSIATQKVIGADIRWCSINACHDGGTAVAEQGDGAHASLDPNAVSALGAIRNRLVRHRTSACYEGFARRATRGSSRTLPFGWVPPLGSRCARRPASRRIARQS